MENSIKLSIQVSLNGLSFCVLDTSNDTVLKAEKAVFAKKRTPYGLLKHVKFLFTEHDIHLSHFSEVVVIHRNNLFGLVPQILFNADQLPNYLKFNSKILANDHMAYDEIEALEAVNVFVPFVNINNYIYEGFGAFTFKHHGTVMLESLLSVDSRKIDGGAISANRSIRPVDSTVSSKEPVCYVHVFERQIDIAVIAQQQLLLFNCFDFVTKEDFLYYLLFTMEQLQLDTSTIAVKLFGDIEEGDDIFNLCFRYVKNINVIVPTYPDRVFENTTEEALDFTVLNAL